MLLVVRVIPSTTSSICDGLPSRAFIVVVDLALLQNRRCKNAERFVETPPGQVDGEEPQARGRQADRRL